MPQGDLGWGGVGVGVKVGVGEQHLSRRGEVVRRCLQTRPYLLGISGSNIWGVLPVGLLELCVLTNMPKTPGVHSSTPTLGSGKPHTPPECPFQWHMCLWASPCDRGPHCHRKFFLCLLDPSIE